MEWSQEETTEMAAACRRRIKIKVIWWVLTDVWNPWACKSRKGEEHTARIADGRAGRLSKLELKLCFFTFCGTGKLLVAIVKYFKTSGPKPKLICRRTSGYKWIYWPLFFPPLTPHMQILLHTGWLPQPARLVLFRAISEDFSLPICYSDPSQLVLSRVCFQKGTICLTGKSTQSSKSFHSYITKQLCHVYIHLAEGPSRNCHSGVKSRLHVPSPIAGGTRRRKTRRSVMEHSSGVLALRLFKICQDLKCIETCSAPEALHRSKGCELTGAL